MPTNTKRENGMDFDQIKYEKKRDVSIITLNRPDRLNAWTHTMGNEMIRAITDSNNDKNIGAIIVTGAGRGFCAGADMQDTFQTNIDGESRKMSVDWVSFIRQSKPLIAAVNGATVGVGLTMVLCFDIIIAAKSSRFSLGFIKMGVVPELASSHFLVQRVGFGRANEMALTGRLYSAQEAFDRGLPDQLVEDDELMDSAIALGQEIAANPKPQARMIKTLFTENGCETDLALVQKREMAALKIAYQSHDHKEAVSAFIEKRKPVFTD
jgi:enoyl-CoA hydratase/carnithine racemase